MSDKYFVDTNILVYAHNNSASAKQDRARTLMNQLWDSGQGVLSTQVLQELYINIRRKAANPVSPEEARSLLHDYSTWEVFTNTPSSILQALEIEDRYKISFWDALIVCAAEASGASVLYSEDLANGQRYGAVRVVNPLMDPISA